MKTALLSIAMILLMVACATVVGPDNVSFPTGYKSQVLVATVDRADNKQVRDVYVSSEAAKLARAGRPLPNGSVFTLEIYQARADAKGELAKDANGRLVKGDLTTVFVMEKRTGFGAGYPDDLRNGEWEYARFAPDGQRVPNVDTKPCLQCHKPLAKQDFVFSLPRLTGAAK
jgi:hypothetical protein